MTKWSLRLIIIWLRVWSISLYQEGRRELGLFSLAKRRRRGIPSVRANTWSKGVKMTDPGSFQWCPVTGPEAPGTHWNKGGSLWTSGNTFSLWGWPRTGTSCPERLWILLLEDIQKLSRHGPGQLTLRGHAWTGGLDQMTSRDPFHPWSFCVSATLSERNSLQWKGIFQATNYAIVHRLKEN